MIARNSGIGCKACLNKSVHGRHRRIEQRDRHSQLGGLGGNAFHGFIQISNAKNDQGARLRVSTDQDRLRDIVTLVQCGVIPRASRTYSRRQKE